MDMEQKKIRYLEKIKQLRLMDDTFFNSCFDGNIPCMEVVLRAVLGNDRLRVTEVITQQSVPNLYGRAVRFDALATDGETIYDVEIQHSDEGANPRRARFNSSMIDSREVSKGTLFPDLPETYVIFITEHDVWKRGKSLYKVRRTFEDTADAFDDGTHILYVNGECQSDDPLGRLMHDFFCTNPNDMYSEVLAERARFFKEDEKGVTAMCRVMEELYNEGVAEGHKEGIEKGRAEGRIESARRTAAALLALGKLTLSQIAEATQLPQEEVERLAGTSGV